MTATSRPSYFRAIAWDFSALALSPSVTGSTIGTDWLVTLFVSTRQLKWIDWR